MEFPVASTNRIQGAATPLRFDGRFPQARRFRRDDKEVLRKLELKDELAVPDESS